MENSLDPLADNLDYLINKGKSYDGKLDWLFLNTLWYHPELRKKFTIIVSTLLEGVTKWSNDHIILVLDGAASTHGLIPIIGQCADKVNSRLAIWREVLPVSVSESWILPLRLEKKLKCVIVQDVVSKGSMLFRVSQDLKYLEWQIEKYVSLATVEKNKNYFHENLERFKKTVICGDSFEAITLLKI